MFKLLSEKVKKTPSTEVSADRYTWISLDQSEPDLGVPPQNDSILISAINGNRSWTDLNTLLSSNTISDVFTNSNNLTIGYNSTLASETNISSGETGSGLTKTINIGTGGADGSTTNITLGSEDGNGITTVNNSLIITGATAVAGSITLRGFVNITGNSLLLSTTDENQILDTFLLTSIRTAKYIIQAVSGSNIHCTEVLVTHNNTNVYITEYGTVLSGAVLMSISAIIDSSSVNIVVTPTTADTVVGFNRMTLAAGSALPPVAESLEGDLQSGTGSVDLLFESGAEDLMDDSLIITTVAGDLQILSGTLDLDTSAGTEDLTQ